MTTKGWVVLAFLVIAVALFLIVSFNVFTWNGHDLVALGLASLTAALIVHIYMHGSELAA